jgi:hypothetical protein
MPWHQSPSCRFSRSCPRSTSLPTSPSASARSCTTICGDQASRRCGAITKWLWQLDAEQCLRLCRAGADNAQHGRPGGPFGDRIASCRSPFRETGPPILRCESQRPSSDRARKISLSSTEPRSRSTKQGVSGAVAQGDNEATPVKPLILWWARQDSNLQPDRYERPALTIELQAPPRTAALLAAGNGALRHDPEKWRPVFRGDHAERIDPLQCARGSGNGGTISDFQKSA